MPVDLSPAGLPRAYPTNRPRLVPWLIGWVLCNGIGSAVALLLWPARTPASGSWFWFCVVAIPNGMFFIAMGIARAGYEALWLRTHYWNMHRFKWLNGRVRYAQQPLQVLGVGYCLPLGGTSLTGAIAAAKPLPKIHAPRNGPGMIVHNRFGDNDPQLDIPAMEAETVQDEAIHDESGTHVPAQAPVSPAVNLILRALEPLAASLHALSRYEPVYWPRLHVLASAAEAGQREQQARDALRMAGLPALQSQAVPPTDGLLVADAWLDAGEKHPLLVIAVEWHDTQPPPASTEGAVAILLGPGVFVLPEPVKVMATLHRPVAGELNALTDVLANAVLWGNADAPTVKPAWISGLEDSQETDLLAALEKTSLAGVTELETQRRPDSLIGHAGAAGGWLSIAAAVESAAAGPHLILHAPQHTQTAQAAILHVPPATDTTPPHDESNE